MMYDVEYGDYNGDGNEPSHSFDAIHNSGKFTTVSVDQQHDHQQKRRSNGLQLAKNLAAYCENQQKQSKCRISNTGDLKMINKINSSSTNTAMTIYDYYDNNYDHGRSRTLPWPTNGNSTSTNEPEAISTPKLSDDNKHPSITSLFTRSPIDGQVKLNYYKSINII
ncbi:hypothetical protein BLA29_006426 [Euroglyphus maynei]|uniref:Uncharacterized protein n=1 Tax=Euroglyphus maynei TaxID=6958 RepID=A0A1Y3ATE2_EURMA|nr:hypothetical protein BLA29_006426 [Euroglyphus maynei]